MDFFATGAFQQLYSELEEPAIVGVDCFDQDLQQQQQLLQSRDCCYVDVNFGNGFETGGMDYYGIITLDSNNNNNNSSHNNLSHICSSNSSSSEDQELLFDFGVTDTDSTLADGAASAPPELSDWEQRLLDHFVEIPELIDILPERTPLCTDMCDDFLQESNNNLRLAVPSSPGYSASATATPMASASAPMQLSQNAAGEKGYLCTFGSCEKLYAKPAHLKAHLRRHMGEKPYACNWPDCSWRFSRSDELARHRRSHSGIKPYKCDYCAKCFARSDHLTKHRKVHERRLLAATRSGKLLPNGPLPQSVYSVRPGRKRKNQL
ncbi:Krueppel-like factor 9 [Drosophila virilis]|uniref:Krueppel-like factor 9 n=1 Tax=Drosophila virilis TaxID=7244 RepID=UPI00017D4EA4|nr:Krueppel-like factor 9 [Drosophila virilis]